jgi:Fur family ferric uptake transcriptional regulator
MDYHNILKKKGVRATRARLSVLNVLQNITQPVDIAYIVEAINKEGRGCDQATVYRCVELLVKKGLVRQVDFREGKYRYELVGDHHHHLVCSGCGKVEPVYDDCLALTDTDIVDKYSFKVTEHHLEYFGLCQKCHSQ